VHPVLAALCGLALAGGTHGARAAVRPAATAATAGLANPVVSFLEDTVALALLDVLVAVWATRRLVRFFRGNGQARHVPR
jgi:hypothetical protein